MAGRWEMWKVGCLADLLAVVWVSLLVGLRAARMVDESVERWDGMLAVCWVGCSADRWATMKADNWAENLAGQ